MALYNITGNGFLDGLLSGIGNVATGGGLAQLRQQQSEQERQQKLAEVASGGDPQKMAMMLYSPAYMKAQLEALTPQFGLERQKVDNANAYQMGSLDVNRGQLTVQQQQQALAQQKYEAEQRAAQAQAEQRARLSEQLFGGGGGQVNPAQLGQLAMQDPEAASAMLKAQELQMKAQGKDPDTFDMAMKLRKEFTGEADTYIKQRDAYGRMAASVSDPSPAGDLSVIFNYMKLLDPGSTVREGEFATAESAGSVPTQIMAKYNKILSGERLTPEQRSDFYGRAEKLYQQSEGQFNKLSGNYKSIAEKSGLPVDQVIMDMQAVLPEGQKPAASTTQPAPAGGATGGSEPVFNFDPASGGFAPVGGGTGQNEVQGNSGIDTLGFIKQAEGFKPNTYDDGVGNQTIGYGHKITGQETTNDPEQLLQQDISSAAQAVDKLVQVPLTEGQKQALVSFVYNGGPGMLEGSTLLQKLNAGDYKGAAKEFGKFIYATDQTTGEKKKLKGLANRRLKERNMFLQGVA